MKIITVEIFALAALLILLETAAAGVLPVGLKEYELVYDRLERVEILTMDNFDYQLGSYRFDRPDFSIAPFSWLKNIEAEKIKLFSFIGEDFRAAKDLRSSGYETFRAGIAGQPYEKLFVYGCFVLDEEKAEDESYTGKKWRGFAGDVEEAFVNWQTEKFDLTAGRFGSFWGPRHSLVLGYNERLDGFGYTFRWGRLAISYRLARLDGLSPESDNVTQFENRYFAGHRFDFHFNPRLRVGLFETVVFGGPGRQLDLFYLNPLIFFHGSQLNENTNDNTMVGFDFTFKPRAGYKFYGQLLVDDIQLDDKEQSDREPDEIAFLLGAQTAGVLVPVDIRLEYTRVANRTFNQVLPRNRYTVNDELIGAASGNDYDLSQLVFSRWLNDNAHADLDISYCRRGEGRVTADWDEPWLEIEGDYSEKFPTGTVEKTFRAALAFKGFVKKMFYVDITAGIDRIDNYGHIDGEDKTRPFFNLVVSAFAAASVNLK